MARVEIAAQSWGWVTDTAGNGLANQTVTLKNTDGTNATHWSAITGGSSLTTALTTQTDGTLPRFIEAGTYDMTIGATTRRVEAVSGGMESDIAAAATYVDGPPTGATAHDTPLVLAAIAAAGTSGDIVLGPGNWQLDLGTIGAGTAGTGVNYRIRGCGPYSTIISPKDATTRIMKILAPGDSSSDYFGLDMIGVCLPADRAYDVPLIEIVGQKGQIDITPSVRFYAGDPTVPRTTASYTGTMLKLDGTYEGRVRAAFRTRKYAIPIEVVNTTNNPFLGTPPNLDTLEIGGTINGSMGHVFRDAYADVHTLKFDSYKITNTVDEASPPQGETTVSTAANIGDTSLIVTTAMVEGTMPAVNDTICIDFGDKCEINKVTGVSVSGATTLTLAQPLRFAHATTMPVIKGGKALSLGSKIGAVNLHNWHFEGFFIGVSAADCRGIFFGTGWNGTGELCRMEAKTQSVVFGGPIISQGTPSRHTWLRKAPTYNTQATPDFSEHVVLCPPVAPNPLPGYYITPTVFFNTGNYQVELKRTTTSAAFGALAWVMVANVGTSEARESAFEARAGATLKAKITYNGQATVNNLIVTRLAKTASYTVVEADPGLIAVTDTTAARAITLPAATVWPAGTRLTVKDESGAAATNNITISRAGSDTIDGATTKVINTNYGVATIYTDGTSKWFTV